jgi:hypothetical protein
MVFLSFSYSVFLFYIKVPTMEQKDTRKGGRPSYFGLWIKEHKRSKTRRVQSEALRGPNNLSFSLVRSFSLHVGFCPIPIGIGS